MTHAHHPLPVRTICRDNERSLSGLLRRKFQTGNFVQGWGLLSVHASLHGSWGILSMSVCWSPVGMSLGQALWCLAQTRWQCLCVYGGLHDLMFPAKFSSQTRDACEVGATWVPCRCYESLEFRYSNATKGAYNAIISIFGSWPLCQLLRSVELLLNGDECLQLLLPLCLFFF